MNNNTNIIEEIKWVAGIKHPTFSFDDPNNILADYSSIEEAKNKISLDLDFYTKETTSKLNNAILNVTYGLSKAKQKEVLAMSKAIEDAIAGLEYNVNYSEVQKTINKANSLIKTDYEDFSSVENAVNSASAITEESSDEEIVSAICMIRDAVAGLKYKQADYSMVDI